MNVYVHSLNKISNNKFIAENRLKRPTIRDGKEFNASSVLASACTLISCQAWTHTHNHTCCTLYIYKFLYIHNITSENVKMHGI